MESFLTDAAEQGTNEVLGRWHTEELYLNSLRIGLGVIRKDLYVTRSEGID